MLIFVQTLKDIIMEFTTIGKAKKQIGLSYLGGVNISAKMIKNQKVSKQLTYVIYLAPAMVSGYNVCEMSTPECRLGCLSTSGRAGMSISYGDNRAMNARISKTKLFYENRTYFMNWLIAEITYYQKQAKTKKLGFSVRLNGTSDIDWANVNYKGKNIFEYFPEVDFYDYTKNPTKFFNKPENYHLTFSYSGRNVVISKKLLDRGENVAVIFNIKKETELPKKFMGYHVVNGDLTDFRPDDGKGVIVGLKWKRIANKENNDNIKKSIFVVQTNDERCEY